MKRESYRFGFIVFSEGKSQMVYSDESIDNLEQKYYNFYSKANQLLLDINEKYLIKDNPNPIPFIEELIRSKDYDNYLLAKAMIDGCI